MKYIIMNEVIESCHTYAKYTNAYSSKDFIFRSMGDLKLLTSMNFNVEFFGGILDPVVQV